MYYFYYFVHVYYVCVLFIDYECYLSFITSIMSICCYTDLWFMLCIICIHIWYCTFTSELFFHITDGKTLRDVRWFFPDAGTQGRKAQRRIPSAEFCFQGWQYEFLNHLALKHQLDIKRFNMYIYIKCLYYFIFYYNMSFYYHSIIFYHIISYHIISYHIILYYIILYYKIYFIIWLYTSEIQLIPTIKPL